MPTSILVQGLVLARWKYAFIRVVGAVLRRHRSLLRAQSERLCCDAGVRSINRGESMAILACTKTTMNSLNDHTMYVSFESAACCSPSRLMPCNFYHGMCKLEPSKFQRRPGKSFLERASRRPRSPGHSKRFEDHALRSVRAERHSEWSITLLRH